MSLKNDLSYRVTHELIFISINMRLDKAQDLFYDVEDPTENQTMTLFFKHMCILYKLATNLEVHLTHYHVLSMLDEIPVMHQ